MIDLIDLIRHRLRTSPRIFDLAKNIGRTLGNRTPLYTCLHKHIPNRVTTTFIQIGAADGLIHDPYREFILRSNMKGILVEPLPYQFKQLQRNYGRKSNLIFEPSAVCYPPSSIDLFVLDEDFLARHPNREILALQASSSLDRFRHSIALCGVLDGDEHITHVRAVGVTIEELLEKNGLNACDCLFMDMEGCEPEVLLNLDYGRVMPKLIAFETIYLGKRSSAVHEYLEHQGFRLFRFRQDSVAVAPEWLS